MKGGISVKYKRFGDQLVVKLDVGDEVVASLVEIAEQEDIQAAEISGIGAVDHVKLAFFQLETKDYAYQQFDEAFEVLSLIGNFTRNKDKYHPHVHIVLGRDDFSTIGGHLNEAYTSVTMEIVLNVVEGIIERQPDEVIGLDLIDFS